MRVNLHICCSPCAAVALALVLGSSSCNNPPPPFSDALLTEQLFSGIWQTVRAFLCRAKKKSMKRRFNCLKAEETGGRGVKTRLTPDMTEGCVKNRGEKKKKKKKQRLP